MSNARNLARLLPNASGQLPSQNMKAGTVLQVVSTYTNSVSAISPTTNVNVLSLSITPSSVNSKILVLGETHLGNSNGSPNASVNVYRNGTIIGAFTDGSRKTGIAGQQIIDPSTGEELANVYFNWLDSPASTGSLSYIMNIGSEDGTTVINRVGSGADSPWATRSYTTLTLMEIAG